jgi:serine/threonine-protein kinase HipA
VVFSWWVGNGDFHLKNVSLVENEEQRMQLSPAYDLMSTSVALGLAHTTAMMPGLGSRTWQQFAAQCGITPHAARRVLDNVSTALAPAEALIRASYLPLDQQHAYVALLRQRAWSIASNVPAPILAV